MSDSPEAAHKDPPEDASAEKQMSPLTPRLNAVASCVVKGKTNKEIAEDLEISVPGVKKLLFRLYRHLDVGNRTEAAIRLLSGGVRCA